MILRPRKHKPRRLWRDVLKLGFSCDLQRIKLQMRRRLEGAASLAGAPMDGSDRSVGVSALNVLD
jgi:hypothetical protein